MLKRRPYVGYIAAIGKFRLSPYVRVMDAVVVDV